MLMIIEKTPLLHVKFYCMGSKRMQAESVPVHRLFDGIRCFLKQRGKRFNSRGQEGAYGGG